METLDEFNNKARQQWREMNEEFGKPIKKGIACPKCGVEMYDISPNIILTSDPPQKHIHCDCGYRGYRVS